MKKLIISTVIVAFTIVSEAASINWSTGVSVKSVTSDTNPAFGTTNAGTGTLSVYVWLVNADTYGSVNSSTIWANYGSKLGDATASVTGKSGAAGATVQTSGLTYSSETDTAYYALVIIGLDTNCDGTLDYYIANKAESNINTAGKGTTVGNLAKNFGGTGGTAITGWTPVPEPTSGLLMLLGVATLALRRRHA